MPNCPIQPISIFIRILISVCVLFTLQGCDRAAAPEASLEVSNRHVTAGALAQTGDRLLMGSSWHGGAYWDLDKSERLYIWNHARGESTVMTAVALSPDAHWALTSDSNTLVLWSTLTGAAQQYWSSPANVHAVALSANGDQALLGLQDHRAALYNVKLGGMVRSFPHEDPVMTVALSADGRRLLTGSGDGSAVLWDSETGEALARQQHSVDVHLVRLSADGERALSATRYDGVSIWSTGGESPWTLPQKKERLKRGLRVTAARFSDDGTYLLTGQPDGLVQLWDIGARELMQSWRLPKRKRWQPIAPVVLDVAFTEDLNRYIALGSNGFVYQLRY